MVRDLERLANEAFDVLVIGGGIYGLALAHELSARGVRTALVDRGDFGGATSFNSLKTVHGGIRALQHGALPTVRQFVRERRALAALAPHLVRPLPFVIPTHRHPVRNRPLMAAFLAAYNALTADRNDGVDPPLALPPARTLSRGECLALNPFIDPGGVTGGALWYDYQLHSPERLALGLLHAAVERGAAAANYIEARGFLQQHNAVCGARLRDLPSGRDFDLPCRVVVNAAGPWAWPLLRQAGAVPAAPAPAMSLAMNVVIDLPPPPHAAGGLADGRFLFLVPWRDRCMIGTSHAAYDGEPDALALTGPLLTAFLEDAAQAFPRAGIGADGVRLVHRGLLPAARGADLLKHSIVRDHARDGVHGLVTVVGVRYTTARATAAAAAGVVVSKLRGSHPAAPPAPLGDVRAAGVAQIARELPALAAPLSAGCPTTRAEVAYAVRREMALHLTDVLLRRTDAGTAGHPGAAAVQAAAAVMAEELGWSPSQSAEEIAGFDSFFLLPSSFTLSPPSSARTPSG